MVKLQLVDLITGGSGLYGTHAFLEEDRDGELLLKSLKSAGYEVKFREQVARFKDSRIREYPRYSAASCRERAERPQPAPGLIAEFGNKSYVLKKALTRKGWEVQSSLGASLRMSAHQLAQARLRQP